MRYNRSKGEAPTIHDCHLHTEFSGDSNTSTNLQAEGTIKLGMRETCVTDYHDYDSGLCGRDLILNIPAYFTALRMLRVDYRDRIRINIEVELGLQEYPRQYLGHFVKRYGDSFGFIIGFSYFVESVDPYNPECWNSQGEVTGFENFFKASLVYVKGLCHTSDSSGYLDYAARYALHQNGFYDYRHLSQWTDPLLKIPIGNGKSLECNTGGFKYSLGQPNPYRKILMRYRELDGEMITIGSDVHTPEYVGYAFDICRELLLDCGYKYFIVYHGREPEFIPLQPGNG